MENAAFSIESYQFDRVEMDLSNHKNKGLEIGFQVEGSYFQAKSKYELKFEVHVFNEKMEAKPFVKVRCKGLFSFDNVSTFEEIPSFFYSNSIAILFPYLRAYLSLVTTQANVPGIILPTLNLSSLETDLIKNTSQV